MNSLRNFGLDNVQHRNSAGLCPLDKNLTKIWHKSEGRLIGRVGEGERVRIQGPTDNGKDVQRDWLFD